MVYQDLIYPAGFCLTWPRLFIGLEQIFSLVISVHVDVLCLAVDITVKCSAQNTKELSKNMSKNPGQEVVWSYRKIVLLTVYKLVQNCLGRYAHRNYILQS